MKKLFFFAIAAVMTSTVISSCSHDDYQGSTVQSPAVEKPVIDSFISAKGLSMMDDNIWGATDLEYNLISVGDTINGRINTTALNNGTTDTSVVVFKVFGETLNGVNFINTDSTLKVDFASSSNSTLVNSLLQSYTNSNTVLLLYLTYLGKGGSLEFVSPSAYLYGPVDRSINNITIPANSPIYYKLQVVDVTTPALAASNTY